MREQSTSLFSENQPEAETVEYRDVSGFSGYRVGNDGSVWSRWNRNGTIRPAGEWRLVHGGYHRSGYRHVGLMRGRKKHTLSVAGLVLAAFVGHRPDGMQCCHGNGVRGDNRLSNLRWDTPLNNHADKKRHGTTSLGSKNPTVKLTEADIPCIRQLISQGKTNVAIGKMYGLANTTISAIRRGLIWKHL